MSMASAAARCAAVPAQPARTAAPGEDGQAEDLAVLSHHGRSFRLAGRLLGPDAFRRATTLYAACRAVDDLADEMPDRAMAAAALRAVHDDLCDRGPGTTLGDRFRGLDVDLQAAAALVDTMLGDLQPVRIADQAALLRYATGAAGTVGLMMCDGLGVSDPAARRHAVDLGIAMQLTNIARDVREDAARDRVYLPQDWLPEGPGQMTLLRSGDPAVFPAVRRLLTLAEAHYRSGSLGYPFLPGRASLAIPVAAALYRAIGSRILAAGPDYLHRPRIVVGTLQRARLVGSCLLRRSLGRGVAHLPDCQPAQPLGQPFSF